MKRKLSALALVAIMLSMLAYGSLAYFTAEETAHNVITSGGISLELLEWADEEKTVAFPQDGIHNVMPGTETTKIFEVKNTGSTEAYIRVKVSNTIALVASEETADTTLMSLDFNATAWTEQDGYYYYNTPLASGAVTAPLFTKVAFSTKMSNIYQNSTAYVDVAAYAVQTAHNGTSALTATGWPAEAVVG